MNSVTKLFDIVKFTQLSIFKNMHVNRAFEKIFE